MPDALFVGGGTGGGKTTLARLLAARHGLRVLAVDSFWTGEIQHRFDEEPEEAVALCHARECSGTSPDDQIN